MRAVLVELDRLVRVDLVELARIVRMEVGSWSRRIGSGGGGSGGGRSGGVIGRRRDLGRGRGRGRGLGYCHPNRGVADDEEDALIKAMASLSLD